jgi:hypothetical protein
MRSAGADPSSTTRVLVPWRPPRIGITTRIETRSRSADGRFGPAEPDDGCLIRPIVVRKAGRIKDRVRDPDTSGRNARAEATLPAAPSGRRAHSNGGAIISGSKYGSHSANPPDANGEERFSVRRRQQ